MGEIDESWSTRQLTCYGQIENGRGLGERRIREEKDESGSARQLTCYERIENEDSVKVMLRSVCERGE